jgi:cardiolipin synthase (CMP-forming)
VTLAPVSLSLSYKFPNYLIGLQQAFILNEKNPAKMEMLFAKLVYKSSFIAKRSRHVVLTYANQLTILRMLFVPCFVILLIYDHPKSATILFLIAGITDGLDGLLARKLQQKTVLGSFLDPMADKILLTAAFVTLSIPSLPLVLHIPTWLTVLTISRDLIIAVSVLIIHLQTQHSQFPPSMLGKCTTTVQLLLVGTCLFANFEANLATAFYPYVKYSTLAFTLASGLHYAYRSVKIIAAYQEAGNGQKRNQNP